MATQYRLVKNYIPAGQPGDPVWAERYVFVARITSGSYIGTDDIYSKKKDVLIAIDQMDLEDHTDYKGWGQVGLGRIYLPMELDEKKKYKNKITRELIKFYDRNSEYTTKKKLKPEIQGVYPSSGSWGDIIYVSGTNLYGCVEIEFGGGIITYNVTESSDNILEMVVPTESISGKIKILNYDGKSENTPEPFIIDGQEVHPLSFDSFTPESGSISSIIFLSGSGFSTVDFVKFGDITTSFDIVTDHIIETNVPLITKDENIFIENSDGEVVESKKKFILI